MCGNSKPVLSSFLKEGVNEARGEGAGACEKAIIFLPHRRQAHNLTIIILNKTFKILVQYPNEGFVGIAIRFLFGCKREKTNLTHLSNVGEFLVVVTICKR